MMKNVNLVLGVICLLVAVAVFAFADGARRWYSGIFYVILGLVMLANALNWRRGNKE